MRRVVLPLTSLLAAVLLAVTFAACGGAPKAAEDPLAGYWAGGGKAAQHDSSSRSAKDGGTRTRCYANPNYEAPAPTPSKNGDSLVLDTHAVTHDVRASARTAKLHARPHAVSSREPGEDDPEAHDETRLHRRRRPPTG